MEKRRTLRNNLTPAETKIWAKLRGRQVENCKFRRQYSIGAFVVDFYLPELKLAIEIDGESHIQPRAMEYDQERQLFLEAKGIRVMRFTNEQVYQKLDGVVEAIAQTILQLRQSPSLHPTSPVLTHPNPPLYKGREQFPPFTRGD
ncbi:endonuclease domain-containing protein [Calothrix sp. 336/3]|uniref:endonuclease domain-containing protein n=1 Tax=Calothrix sp. 336/3 TaxID=1337936 RepID=UPI001EDD391F|nr:endonuclease domain-containing protein [Calothrix sp. 336/3]